MSNFTLRFSLTMKFKIALPSSGVIKPHSNEATHTRGKTTSTKNTAESMPEKFPSQSRILSRHDNFRSFILPPLVQRVAHPAQWLTNAALLYSFCICKEWYFSSSQLTKKVALRRPSVHANSTEAAGTASWLDLHCWFLLRVNLPMW